MLRRSVHLLKRGAKPGSPAPAPGADSNNNNKEVTETPTMTHEEHDTYSWKIAGGGVLCLGALILIFSSGRSANYQPQPRQVRVQQPPPPPPMPQQLPPGGQMDYVVSDSNAHERRFSDTTYTPVQGEQVIRL
eukprot:TRINITY_DN22048_c0_g1_i1.p1 TRINITY_DN22048_c0_g1~~TRINITY_DN22048_c0_g1_i1.p1  ORF type:complete len:133 (+),score=37.81 TRINITY_DN22048_c0_g1_i1:58-456(+)